MKMIHGLDQLPAELRSGAVTIGNFDGVHRGHARIMQRLLAAAQSAGGPAVVVTFDPHPARLLRPADCPLPLTWTTRKARLLDGLGMDAMVICATDRRLLNWSPDEFFAEIIRRRLDARAIVEGPNFFFGRDRAGTIDVLRKLSAEAGVELEVVDPFELEGHVVSSSRIRRSIAAGDVQLACQMLTEPYRIRGMVTHGDARGAQIGFPTANLDAIDTLLPAAGVYAGRGCVADRLLPAAINIGPSPTFGLDLLRVEIHLIGFQGDLYGEPLEVDFLRRLRDIQCFDSVAGAEASAGRGRGACPTDCRRVLRGVRQRRRDRRVDASIHALADSRITMSIAWPRFAALVGRGRSFLLTSHVRPDCDALGSELGMARLLEALGKQVTIVNAEPVPATSPVHRSWTTGFMY